MYEIDKRLLEREKAGDPIAVAVVGAGQMGTEIISQIGEMKGMEVYVVVDLSFERAAAGYASSRKKADVVRTNDLAEAEAAVAAGRRIATTDYRLATRLTAVAAVVDATGQAEMGATVSLDAFDHKKHVVMMNVECDVTIGPVLHRFAENAGVVYSWAAGDEPAAILELHRFANALGFEIVAAGKGKNNPLNYASTPDTERAKAEARNMNARMLCEFVDGSKTAVEMAAVSNATGLVPDVRGMHGARSSVADLTRVFVPKAEGGVLGRRGVVDFAIGVHPGVFVIVTTDNPRIRDGLVQRDMGNGPYYTLYRPYHLCSIEVPLTIAQCVLYGESSGHAAGGLVSECIAITKKALKPGDVLDGIGEFCYRGSIETAAVARAERLLPLGLAKGCVVTTEVPEGTPLTYDMVEPAKETVLLQLRRIQDQLYA
ncbi:NAD(P)H-dependent oxidoreductase [Pleomorphomonas carboxyditropha]|uniref:NAD(P)-dependent oxidoreductase n=1 Tax=Pleomorphomonas carboxyditropha TaxID=2023338 RepID=A0A2G9WZZ8_9HYPH|nr:NAD(P)-dependent oxidoreductase [Pleomorphomonas carboxyditropha]PIP00289.1 NAD(P)-dependent oxidoreductase [Pleomorphomonas carboxyditropha]